jgi:hypothetical protein
LLSRKHTAELSVNPAKQSWMSKFKSFFSCIVPLLLCTIYFAQAQDIEKKIQFSFSTGRHQEDFHWSIAGNNNGTSPNVLSELKWKNVSGQDYSTSLQWNIWRKFLLFADYNRISVHSGSVNDVDYNGDNRTDPIYTGNFSDNKGYTGGWSSGAGYIIFNNNLFSLAPYLGYTENSQNLYLVDLTGQFPGLNSSYQAWWKGAFLKLQSSVKIVKSLKLSADITYNQVNYSAQGDWNLITEFQHPVSYRHVAKGYGLNTNARLIYDITNHIAISICYSYFDWETGDGNDMLYLATGSVDKTRLNGVSRYGYQVAGGVVLSL